ncbi:ECF-type riboflavin transporter substrate-binding protein [Weissella diestrammenae]|uniref:ECF-type riboflavin transporter substrate-binding protein n=1 Tax=Weissella diestrammenae TaxID=1162633 RepID=A0A7G9T464_9LACO|nr:ECF-type riboflavin transporter substrate-binding protein [Weissella diestrammenae]MCM0583413.1 ECF-type riboflavin transporter substrate-binding protein [Weissella diestrammenae]QNN74889.1 ECF-type riboflavin transporter substrate-binding protein [Weissella diestrammenae]
MKKIVRVFLALLGGTLLFFCLMSALSMSTGVVRTQINFAEAWLAFITALFGPIIGLLVALIGHALHDSVILGGIWWSWVIADGLFGLLLGLATQRLDLVRGTLTRQKLLYFNIWQLLANLIAWGVIAPLGDILIYGETLKSAFVQGLTAVVVNFGVIAIFGSLMLVAYNYFFRHQR